LSNLQGPIVMTTFLFSLVFHTRIGSKAANVKVTTAV